jgi:hypothetical protein
MPTKEELEALEGALEEKFKKILALPDVVIPADEVDGAFTEEQRATLQAALEAEMPSAEEIECDAGIAEHNQKVHWARQAKLAQRRARQTEQGKRKHRRG